MKRAALVSTLILACLSPGVALADEAAAESLFKAATELVKQGKYAEACPKFAESQREAPAIGTLLALGHCYRQDNKTASAWAVYKQIAFESRKAHDDARADAATKLAADLEKDLSTLRIDAADPSVSGMIIHRDGEEVGRPSLGTPIAVDPGTHVIEATAPGYEVWRATVNVGGPHDQKSITIPALQKSGTADAAGPATSSEGSKTKRLAGFITGGAGVAILGVGAVFGVLTFSGASTLHDDPKLCGQGGKCTHAGDDAVDAAKTKGTISTILIPVGVAAAGVGAYLVLTSGPRSEPAKSAAVGVRVGPGFARVEGSF